MSTASIPKEILEVLGKTDKFVCSATLVSPHKIEGTVAIDQKGGNLGTRGDFSPKKAGVSISANERGQLLLAKSSIVLNVVLTPCRSEACNVDYIHFELVAWEPFDPSL